MLTQSCAVTTALQTGAELLGNFMMFPLVLYTLHGPAPCFCKLTWVTESTQSFCLIYWIRIRFILHVCVHVLGVLAQIDIQLTIGYKKVAKYTQLLCVYGVKLYKTAVQ